MKTFVGILTATILTAAGGAASAGDQCNYPYRDRDDRSSYDHAADHDRGDAYRGDRDRGDAYPGDRDAYRGGAYHDDAQRRDHAGRRERLTQGDCGDFSCRDWLLRRHAYVFWSPRDKDWYYWCSASKGYLPYEQFEAHPPASGVAPDMPKGLPPLAPGGVDREAAPAVEDLMPPSLPDDAPLAPDAGRFHSAVDKGAPAR